jgi:hypothetical protein
MYTLIILLLLGIIVSLLPAGDSLGFFSLLGALLHFLVSILLFIGQLIIALLILLFSLPFTLFGKGLPLLQPSAPPPFPVLPPVTEIPQAGSNTLLPLLRSILLWGSLAVILVFGFLQFVRQHGGLRAALRNSRLRNWLTLALQWLYRSADQTRGTLSRAITNGWQALISRFEAKQFLPQAPWINIRALDPRRQIYFFFLAMVRRGAEQGIPRRPSQTPSEYATTLSKDLPAVEVDIDSITRAFAQARYSRHDISTGEASLVKAAWRRIRQAMQSRRKSK